MQREFHLYSQENGKNPTYVGVLGDTGRTLRCYMNDVNVLEEVSEAIIWVKKPDGTNVYDDCEVNEDGTITVPITSQMLAVVGEAVAQVQLYGYEYYDGNDGYITSYEFKIIVLDTIVDEDAPQSTNEWGALETLLAKANAVIVSTKAEMTDHDKIYFLSTDGHYYYWSSVDNDFVNAELSHADIVDNLLSDDATKVLSAKQGKILKELIDTHEVAIATVDTPGIVKPDGTTITITEDGTISGAQTYQLPTASATVKGGIKVGDHLHMNNEVLSADGGIVVQDTEPTDVDVWIDTDEEGADFCYVGDTEPPNDGSVAVWVDTSEDERVSTIEVGDTAPTDDNVQIWVDTSEGANLADYIVEQGTETVGTGMTWHYTKWASGKAECYGTYRYGSNNANWVAWGVLFELSGANDLHQYDDYPTDLFIETPKIAVEYSPAHNESTACLIEVYNNHSKLRTPSIFCVRPNNSGTTKLLTVGIEAKGRWK